MKIEIIVFLRQSSTIWVWEILGCYCWKMFAVFLALVGDKLWLDQICFLKELKESAEAEPKSEQWNFSFSLFILFDFRYSTECWFCDRRVIISLSLVPILWIPRAQDKVTGIAFWLSHRRRMSLFVKTRNSLRTQWLQRTSLVPQNALTHEDAFSKNISDKDAQWFKFQTQNRSTTTIETTWCEWTFSPIVNWKHFIYSIIRNSKWFIESKGKIPSCNWNSFGKGSSEEAVVNDHYILICAIWFHLTDVTLPRSLLQIAATSFSAHLFDWTRQICLPKQQNYSYLVNTVLLFCIDWGNP